MSLIDFRSRIFIFNASFKEKNFWASVGGQTLVVPQILLTSLPMYSLPPDIFPPCLAVNSTWCSQALTHLPTSRNFPRSPQKGQHPLPMGDPRAWFIPVLFYPLLCVTRACVVGLTEPQFPP